MPPAITDFSKAPCDYLSDNGQHFTIMQRTAVLVACGNDLPGAAQPGRPARWKLRHIYLKHVDGATGKVYRKRCVIGLPTNPLFVGTVDAVAALDGVAWTVEGRVGELRAA